MLVDLTAACTELDMLVAEMHRWRRIDRIVRAVLGGLTLLNCTLAFGVIGRQWPIVLSYVIAGVVTVLAVVCAYTRGKRRTAYELFDTRLDAYGRAMDLVHTPQLHVVPAVFPEPAA